MLNKLSDTYSKFRDKLTKITIFSNKDSVCVIAILLCFFIFILNYERTIIQRDEIYLKKTNNNIILALIPNDSISDMIKEYSVWEEHVTNFFVSHVQPGEIVVELGANIGYYSTLLAKLVTKTGKVYAYEADSDVIKLADLSLKINKLSDIVELKSLCVSNHKGITEFVCKKPSSDHSFTSDIGGAHIKRKDSEGEIRKVPTVSLDEDLPNLSHVDWMKIDIEGSEILAIQGAKRLIESSPNLKIVMEWAPNMLKEYGNLENLIDYLFESGFSAYDILIDGSLGKKLTKEDLINTREIYDILLKRDSIN